MNTISERIEEELLKWEGVTAGTHRFGGIEFRANRREMGHIHGNSLVDFPFPVQLRKELVFSGKVSLHHVLPESGWASYWIKSDTDFKEIIELFRIQYERLKPKEQSSVSTSNIKRSLQTNTVPPLNQIDS